ncbi:oxidoreductase [Actibacterium mucosum KCTC 23349]|uniref:Oxidoreductase n=1 Tax=Actibacterium mucosum KCTC 23349 TaxID=1454373 RepID=A0A037ZDD8_9RHOB|nr:FAD-binding oxidoreductase [Actibacterium mucosum]KAJ54162.1 oxidoreductase [Actibacterium mucosum KCTC 23349]
MNLLTANDRPGFYPHSWYAATAKPLPPFPSLKGNATTDVAVIGGGFTGLSAALHLAEAGVHVTLLEAQRVGFGASGRNGGQVGSGQRREQDTLEQMMGKEDAQALWQLGEDAKAKVLSLCRAHAIDAMWRPGIVHADINPKDVPHSHAYADHLRGAYGYVAIEKLNGAQIRALVGSPTYHGGYIDRGAAHIHPLRFALGLARAAVTAGAVIHEGSTVERIDPGQPATLQTPNGTLRANHVIVAANGYLGKLMPQIASRVMPINNFIVATEPLDQTAPEILSEDVAVADSKFVVNYFRLSEDRRLLFGGGETYGYRFPKDIASTVRKPMARIFPQLKNVRIDYAWGGTLAITMQRLPLFTRLGSNIVSASGYSGHGVALATLGGQLLAEAIRGPSDGFALMSRLPTPRFPGGAALRSPLLAAAMTWYAMRDKLRL